MSQQLIRKKQMKMKMKKHVSDFSKHLIHDMKTEKKYKSVLLVQKYLIIAKTQHLHNRPKDRKLY